jgi:hypothetical protein
MLTNSLELQTRLVNVLVSARRQEVSATVQAIEQARKSQIRQPEAG